MQSLTVSASVSKRKQACKSCRQRKKRCDGERPQCALCKKWSLRCEYTVPASSQSSIDFSSLPFTPTLFGRQPFLSTNVEQIGLDSLQFPNVNLYSTELDVPIQMGYPTPTSGLDSNHTSNEPDFDQDIIADVGLPSQDILLELIAIFFDNFYDVFPCFHKASFMKDAYNQHLQIHSPILLYAMCCIAARRHPNPDVKNRQNDWYEQAKLLYELMGRDPHPAVRTMQAALCLIYHAYTRGDFSSCWLFLGKAWRQAAAMGMNRMDSSHAVIMALNAQDIEIERRGYYNRIEWEGKTPIEREECRRALWLLFLMDRNQSWPTGWPHAIDERQFKIDIPVAESVFQSMNSEPDDSEPMNTPFKRSIDALIASVTTAKGPLNLFHYLIIAHVLLGRVTELIHSLHDSPDTPEYAEQCEELDNLLVKLRLSLPRTATSIIEAPCEVRGHVVWLNCVLNTMSILLHYRRAKISTPVDTEGHFAKAIIAARNTARIVKDASLVSIDLLLSAHIASSLYLSSIVLVIHSRLARDKSLKGDIELFGLVYDRMNDVFSVIGIKFTLALKRDMERSEEELIRLKDAGYRGLLADCSKWGFVQNEIAKMGMSIQ